MKPLFLSLTLTALTVLAGCGAPFQAGEFSPTGDAGSGGSVSAGGQIGVAHAGSASSPGGGSAAGAPDMESAGAGGEAAGGFGSAGAPQGGTAGAVGAPQGGAGGSATVTPPCDHWVDVVVGMNPPIGGAAICLRTTIVFNHLLFRGWDNRSVKVNGMPFPCVADANYECTIPGPFPSPIAGYSYIDLGANPTGASGSTVTTDLVD